MSEVKEFVKGDKYVLQSGSVMVKIVNYGANTPRQEDWTQQEAEELEKEFADFEEVNQTDSQQPISEAMGKTPNYFAPQKVLKEWLKGKWFKELRTRDEYNEEWTDFLVDALMASEWRDTIAHDWATQGKRSKANKIKGYVVGLLADNGVLKGSYDSIADKASVTDNPRTFSKYMSEGKKQGYAMWFEETIGKMKTAD